MMNLNKFKACFLVGFVISSLLLVNTTFAAPNQANDSLAFTPNGNKYIYSNNPEQIQSTNMGNGVGAYTISQKLVINQSYDAEFNHTNYTGDNLVMGVMICNVGSSPEDVRVYNNKASTVGTVYTKVGADTEKNYWTATAGSTVKTVPDGETLMILTTNTIPALNSVVGKVLFTPLGNNLYCKIVYFKPGYAGQAISFPQAKANGSKTVTGFFDHDARQVTYNYSSAAKKAFYLSLWKPISPAVANTSEYETIQNPLPGAGTTNVGNYGVCYNILLQNAGGKTLSITPDWDNVHNNGWSSQQLAIYDGTTWVSHRFENNTSWSITVPSSNQNIKFILPAGNTGNVYFKFIN